MQDLLQVLQCPGCLAIVEKSDNIFETTILNNNCHVNKCTICGLVYKGQFPTSCGLDKIYSAEYTHFNDGGEWKKNHYYYSAKQKLDRCKKMLNSKASNKSIRILDVGCGSGNFVSVARDLGYDAYGIDPHLPSHCQKPYLENKNLDEISTSSFNIVVLLNVAEHLVSPREFFMEVYRILANDGIVLLTCPYGNSLARKFYQKKWNHLLLDEHLLFWTPKSLSIMFSEIGFKGGKNFRIAGTPFPWGRVQDVEVQKTDVKHLNILKGVSPGSKSNFRTYITRVAQYIQSHEKTANFVRCLVHYTASGDYLEYVIAKNK
ncbi:MAG: class I SAM-dependent methyltransferase [Desulfuromonadales bacterium]|nr:class I SAM-dependent methyltransferase [Desulfuromonadales bacterium]